MFFVIDTDGTLIRRDEPATAAAINRTVGPPGFDIVPIRENGRHSTLAAFVNDEGFRLNLDRNPVGACVIASLGAPAYIYAGPVVITGWDEYANGPEVTDLTAGQVDQIRTIHGFTRRALDGETVGFPGAGNWSDDTRGYAEHVRNGPAPTLTFQPIDVEG